MADSNAPAASCDVLVIGGGPAGSTVSTLLRRKGFAVTLIEKDTHPRFHIGESLLPRNLPIFEELGVMDAIRQIGVVKRGADFNVPGRDIHVLADFSQALDPNPPISFQVKRAEFDHILLRNAERNGVIVQEAMKATSVDFEKGSGVRVKARDSTGRLRTWQARFLVDASGRDTFLANRLNMKSKNSRHDSAALFAHFNGVVRRPGDESGNISLYWFEHGWFWLIPLHDGRMSVGAVCRPSYLKSRIGPVPDFFMDTIALCPSLAKRMKNADLATEVTATGNYSYFSQRMYGLNYLLIGDAYAFIDPVFSTGVFLAMAGGQSAADTIDGCLRNPVMSKRLLSLHERRVRNWLSRYSWFIYRFNSPAMKHLFMTQRNPLRIKSAVLSLMSGDTQPTPTRLIRLLLFKGLYYLFAALNLQWLPNRQANARVMPRDIAVHDGSSG